jgi:FkbH-like protein
MFEFPSDPAEILRKKRALRRQLLNSLPPSVIKKRIALLGGSTTSEFKDCFELFLLNNGIQPEFYESDYDKFYEDSVFGTPKLDSFVPEVIYIFTSVVNIKHWPEPQHTPTDVQDLASAEFERLRVCWNKLFQRYSCPVIQNNFEFPNYRTLGNADFTDHRGNVNYINNINAKIASESTRLPGLYIHDLCYDAACFGLNNWHDRVAWHAYKFAFAMLAIPTVARTSASQVSALFGMSRKCLVLDLDNTLWGGVIGDDGVNGIQLGPETPQGAAFIEFQSYVKKLHDRGVMLAVCSKNENSNALEGLNHPDGILRPEHFETIVANWDPKNTNVAKIAKILNIGLDSMVFIDDNPAEREIVAKGLPQVTVPEVGKNVEEYISIIDRSGYFETTTLSTEDLNRSRMYKENTAREELAQSFEDYSQYLLSLQMEAEIAPFRPEYFDRIHQLINKTNQFNLTTKRCSKEEIINWIESGSHITLFGRLIDKFGDNGLVSIVTAELISGIATIDLWLMSCRVLKRGMEFAMMNALIKEAEKHGAKEIRGSYKKSNKNKMVECLLAELGFLRENQFASGDSEWKLILTPNYSPKIHFIKVNSNEPQPL